MTRTTINELKNRRLDAMTPEERAAFEQTYDATRLALEVGENVRDARDAAGLTQRDLAARMGPRRTTCGHVSATHESPTTRRAAPQTD